MNTVDWRAYRFHPSTLPCCVCGSTIQTGQEPRFGYVVCEEHSALSPVDINKYTRGGGRLRDIVERLRGPLNHMDATVTMLDAAYEIVALREKLTVMTEKARQEYLSAIEWAGKHQELSEQLEEERMANEVLREQLAKSDQQYSGDLKEIREAVAQAGERRDALIANQTKRSLAYKFKLDEIKKQLAASKAWEEAVVCACMKVESCLVSNEPKQTLLNLEQYWFDTGRDEQKAAQATALILDLRQQLEVAKAENDLLRKANLECIQYFNEAQKDLAEKNAEIEHLDRTKTEWKNTAKSLGEQLAASQAREQQLRRAHASVIGGMNAAYAEGLRERLVELPVDVGQIRDIVERHLLWAVSYSEKALVLPQDTSTLAVMIAKAGEVMRRKAADVCVNHMHWWESNPGNSPMAGNIASHNCCVDIHNLSGVTIEDLKNG